MNLSPSERPIFVIGCERSGTTLLRAMLNAHPRIAIPYEATSFGKILSEPSPWHRVWTRSEIEAPIREFLSHRKVVFWAPPFDAILEELGVGAAFRFEDIIRAIYRAHAKREGKPRWGDKTPSNTYRMAWLPTAFPDAQFIHIVRDGRDVYHSWRNVEWGRQYTVECAATKWVEWMWFAYHHGEPLGPQRYRQVRYEDLVQDPVATLTALCRFLDEPFDERMLTYHQQDGLIPESDLAIHPLLSRAPERSRTSAWKRELAQSDVKAFEWIAGPTLLRFGYEVSPSVRPHAQARLFVHQAKERFRRVLAPAAG